MLKTSSVIQVLFENLFEINENNPMAWPHGSSSHYLCSGFPSAWYAGSFALRCFTSGCTQKHAGWVSDFQHPNVIRGRGEVLDLYKRTPSIFTFNINIGQIWGYIVRAQESFLEAMKAVSGHDGKHSEQPKLSVFAVCISGRILYFASLPPLTKSNVWIAGIT